MTRGHDPGDHRSDGVPRTPAADGPSAPRVDPPTRMDGGPGHAAPEPAASTGAHAAPDPVSPASPPPVSSGAPPRAWPQTNPYGYPAQSPAAPAPRRGVLAPVALVLAVVLLLATVVQTVLLMDTRGRLDRSEHRAATARAAADQREQSLEARTKELERKAGNALDAAAVASVVVPSVFLVIIPQGKGSAFAFGPEAPDGGTYLITNAHVVQEEWNAGVRTVALEQTNRRFTAKILKVEASVDLALLSVPDKFPRLQAAPEPAKAGQPIVVVGAPLGFEDVVTSGVVSNLRSTAAGDTLQFDAATNPGNSGGPVVNAQKQVVGVANAKRLDAEGFGLGIPVGTVCKTFSLC